MFKNYYYGGVFSVICAILYIPATVLYTISLFSSNELYTLLGTTLFVTYTVAVLLVYFYFLDFMHTKLGITNADWLIYGLIGSTLVISLPPLFISVEDADLFLYYYIGASIASIVFGVFAIILGQKLRKNTESPVKHVRSAGLWFTISGILFVTVILSPLLLITAVIINIYLALMFFSNRGQEQTDGHESTPETA